MPEMKGVTVRIPAELHAEVKAYLEAHGMTMGEFITQAVDNELHPKIQITQEEPMERMRTLAFQVPDSLFQRVKAYLERNHMTQKQFVVGLIEAELEQDEAQYQASHPEEQEDEGESDEQIQDEEAEQETQEESQDEFAPQEAQDGPDAGLEEQLAAQEDAAPVDDFGAGSEEVSQEDGRAEEAQEEETQEEETLEEREDAEESNALDDMDDGELEDSLEDEEAWEESNDQEDAQDEEEEQSFQPSMAW